MRFFILVLFFLASARAFAEDPTLTMKHQREAVAADQKHLGKCEQMRQRGTCRGLGAEFINGLARDLDSCRVQYAANKCDDFFRQNPTLRALRNTCNSIEVCRNQSEYALLRGCAELGISVSKSALDAVKSFADGCPPEMWRGICFSKNVIKSTAATLWYYMWNDVEMSEIAKLPATSRAAYAAFKRKSACLNQREQQKLACSLYTNTTLVAATAGSLAIRAPRMIAELRTLGAAEALGSAGEGAALNATRQALLDPDDILRASIEKRIGKKVQIIEEGTAMRTGEFRGQVKAISSDSHANVGSMMWLRDASGKNIKIEGMDANIPNKGVGTALFDYMLQKNPKVTRIESVLNDDNFHAFIDARRAGQDCFGALRATPAYKIRAKAGFTKIISSSCKESEYLLDFVVGK